MYKVKGYGYYNNLVDAVFMAKKMNMHIYKIEVNKDTDYKKLYLRAKKYDKFIYLVHEEDGSFYDKNDMDTLNKLKEKYDETVKNEMERKKQIRYTKERMPLVGWCDYPEQFTEKCPEYNGKVMFEKITRNLNPGYIIKDYEDYSSKYVDRYYPAMYIGNYSLEYNQIFEKYDGKSYDTAGKLIQQIDVIWRFKTENFPFDNFWLHDYITKEAKTGCLYDIDQHEYY